MELYCIPTLLQFFIGSIEIYSLVSEVKLLDRRTCSPLSSPLLALRSNVVVFLALQPIVVVYPQPGSGL